MKSANKNKPSSANKCYHQNIQSDQNQPPRPNEPDNQKFCISQEWVDQVMEFHLNDEEPESIIAKRKLEEFSVQLNEEATINSLKRNQNSIILHKISRKSEYRDESEGWTDTEITTSQNPKKDQSKKHKRSQSASQCKIRQTLKIRTQNEKKYSFTGLSSQQKRLNLSFNNLSPFHMDTIPEIELSKELVKKVKSHSSRRPVTASYYGASQKILTLFENTEKQKRTKNNETLRIHSVKENDQKNVSFNKDIKFLKTFSLNSVSKSINRSKRASKNLLTNPLNETSQPDEIKETNKLSQTQNKNRRNHQRTYSETVQKSCSKENKETFEQYSQRKYLLMNQKRQILNIKIKSYENIASPFNRNNNIETNKNKPNNKSAHQNHLIEPSKQLSPNKIKLSYDIDPPSNPIKNPQTPVPILSNLQEDFSLLISMLKNESQNIFGGQLQNYLTQVKNNSLYSYYCSGTYNKKKNGKLMLNTTRKLNKTQKGFLDGTSEHDRMRNLIENQNVTKNNTTLHYRAFSASKHRDNPKDSKESQLIKTSNTSLQK